MRLHQIKVGLAAVRPPVWRRVLLSPEITLGNPLPRARVSSAANSGSLTFVPTDFVRRGGFREHRLSWGRGRGRTLPVRRWEDSRGAGGGLKG
jgi:hypothetical protein